MAKPSSMTGLYTSAPLPFKIGEIANRSEYEHVLLCTPDYFDIVDEKNVHMKGNAGSTVRADVLKQWQELKHTYDSLQEAGVVKEVSVLPGAEDCEDMVFCANQSFPWVMDNGKRVVVMSNMRHSSRQREVPYFEDFFRDKGFEPLSLSPDLMFEGMGDVIPHPGKRLLYGGFGHRTNVDAYVELTMLLRTPIVALELVSEKFYHLDTCFVPLSTDSVMICEEAFSEQGLAMIEEVFRVIHYVPIQEAERFFSLNAHVFDIGGRKVAILQKGSETTRNILSIEGFEVIEVETSEFMKSGGSVFCMKMMYP